MIPVYQTMTVKNDGQGNCFNACIASVLELPLRKVCQVLPKSEGSWIDQWRVWLADQGLALASMRSPLDPPYGYSIVTVYTERTYPEGHPKAGVSIAHSCVAFDGVIVHDPYPLPSEKREIKYYNELRPLTDAEKKLHQSRLDHGRCLHGYRALCGSCPPLTA